MTKKRDKVDSGSSPGVRNMRWAAGAFVAVLAIGAGFFVFSGGSDNGPEIPATPTPSPTTTAVAPPTTTPPTSTLAVTTTVPKGPEAATAVVLDAIDAYNAGDIEGETRYVDEIFMNANRVITVVEPCRVSDVSPNTVVCTLSEVNDWHGAAGLTFEAVSSFEFNDQLQIRDWTDNWACCAGQVTFHHAFWDWLVIEHPDVYADIEPATADGLPGLAADPADMKIALDYVAEFVAQSDDYPIEASDS